MTMAFLPCPTSIYKNPGVSENAAQCPPPLRYNRGHAYEYRSSSLSEVPLKAPISCPNTVSLCWCVFSSYLASRHELQRTQSALHVRDVGLELIQGCSDVGLDLGRFLPRRAVGSDLVERLLRHRVEDVSMWRVRGGGGGIPKVPSSPIAKSQRAVRQDWSQYAKPFMALARQTLINENRSLAASPPSHVRLGKSSSLHPISPIEHLYPHHSRRYYLRQDTRTHLTHQRPP